MRVSQCKAFIREHRRGVALVLALLTSPGVSAQTAIEPPMRIPSQAPLQSTRLALIPAASADLRKGEVRVEFAETWTNVWVNERPALLLDYEALESRVSATWAVTETWVLELETDDRRRFGGAMDASIQNFHQAIGNGLNGRDTVPRNTVNIEVRNPSTGELALSLHDEGTFSRGLSASAAKSRTFLGGRLAFAVTVRVPLQHSGEELATGSDAGLSTGWSRNVAGRSIHLGVGVTRRGGVLVDFPVQRIQRTGLVAVVQPITARTAAVLQYLFNDGVARSGPLSHAAHEVTIGGRFYVTDRTALDFGVIENVLNYDNGPDVGIHLRISRIVR